MSHDMNLKVFQIDGRFFTDLPSGERLRVAILPPDGEEYIFYKIIPSSEGKAWDDFRRRAEAGEFNKKFLGDLQFHLDPKESHDDVVAIPGVKRDNQWHSVMYMCLHM